MEGLDLKPEVVMISMELHALSMHCSKVTCVDAFIWLFKDIVLACKDVGIEDINLQVNFDKEPVKLNKRNEILSILLTHLHIFLIAHYYSVCIYILCVCI